MIGLITDLDEIANKFNTYFINIGHSLSEQVHATRSSNEYLNNRTNTVFNFTEVDEECIDSIIKNMKSKTSTTQATIIYQISSLKVLKMF